MAKRDIEQFSDVKVPQAEHRKALAKAEAKKKQFKKAYPSFHTMNGDKIVRIIVKETSTHSQYVANRLKLEKKTPGSFKAMVDLLKKKGQWADSYFKDEKVLQLRADLLSGKFQAEKSKKDAEETQKKTKQLNTEAESMVGAE